MLQYAGHIKKEKKILQKRSVKVTEIDLSDNSSVLVTMINGDVNSQPAS